MTHHSFVRLAIWLFGLTAVLAFLVAFKAL
jgi:hypothetical protein